MRLQSLRERFNALCALSISRLFAERNCTPSNGPPPDLGVTATASKSRSRPMPPLRRRIASTCEIRRIGGAPLALRPALETGFSMLELALSMMVTAIVLALFAPTLIVLIHGEETVGALTDANTKVQSSLEVLQRQINSASVLFDPINTPSSCYRAGVNRTGTTTTCKGFALLMYTPTSTGAYECSQWRVYQSSLQDRVWQPTNITITAVPFKTLSAGVSIVNTTVTTKRRNRIAQYPFELEGLSPPQIQLSSSACGSVRAQNPQSCFSVRLTRFRAYPRRGRHNVLFCPRRNATQDIEHERDRVSPPSREATSGRWRSSTVGGPHSPGGGGHVDLGGDRRQPI